MFVLLFGRLVGWVFADLFVIQIVVSFPSTTEVFLFLLTLKKCESAIFYNFFMLSVFICLAVRTDVDKNLTLDFSQRLWYRAR